MTPPTPPTYTHSPICLLFETAQSGSESQQKKSSLRHCLNSDGCPCMYGGRAGATAAAHFKRSTSTIPATLFFRLSDMHSKWLGQTCASLIRLFTLLLFFFPSSSPPPSSVSHSWKHKHIHTLRNMPNKRCTMAETLVCVL